MRLLTFKAANIRQAMTLVRRELGEDATIVSTQSVPGAKEVRVVATRQQDTNDPRLGQVAMSREEKQDQILETLLLHGTPLALAERLALAAADMEPKAPATALAGVLDLDFSFSPVDMTADSQRLMLVGPPGAGKTMALVKLAARALMAKRSVQLLTTDLKRAGAVEQLSAFAKVMGQELFITETAEELAQFMARIPNRAVVLVDAPGINHRSQTEMDELYDFVSAAPVEPVLVLGAGLDPLEAADQAMAFGALGTRRMLITRTDTTARLGGVLAAMEGAGLALAGTTGSPDPIDGFYPVRAADMADLLYGEVLAMTADLPLRSRRDGARREGTVAETTLDEILDAQGLDPETEPEVFDDQDEMINVALPAEG